MIIKIKKLDFSGGSENVYLYLGVILTAIVLLSTFNFRFFRVLHMHFLDPGLKYQPDFEDIALQGDKLVQLNNNKKVC